MIATLLTAVLTAPTARAEVGAAQARALQEAAGGQTGRAATSAPAEPLGPAGEAPAIRDLPGFIRLADGWMLAGRMAPPELPQLLRPLAPADRLSAIAYLRRGGLHDGPAMALDMLLDAEAAP